MKKFEIKYKKTAVVSARQVVVCQRPGEHEEKEYEEDQEGFVQVEALHVSPPRRGDSMEADEHDQDGCDRQKGTHDDIIPFRHREESHSPHRHGKNEQGNDVYHAENESLLSSFKHSGTCKSIIVRKKGKVKGFV